MRAYEGKEPYIFVSYAHKDSAIALPIIGVMQDAGFRVWYDQGIEAGTEWPAYIEEHLDNCARFLVFMSPATVESVNCRNEINYASMLKKEILVVYLEDTELRYGLNLQLNSKQSLFRARHATEESFLEELTRAKLLSLCQEGAEGACDTVVTAPTAFAEKLIRKEERTREAIVLAHIRGDYVIARVGSVGVQSASDPWAKGEYTQEIDIARCSVINFHCNLLKPMTREEERTVSIRVYDERSALVFENDVKILFKEGDSKFSTGWIIKEENGFRQMCGGYTALIFVDDSRVYEYPFSIVEKKSVSEKNSEERSELEKKLSYPKLLRFHLFAWVIYIFFFAFVASEMVGLSLILAAASLVVTILYGRKTRKCLDINRILTLFLILPASFYYGFFLLVMSFITLINYKKWKKRLKELE